MLNKAPTQYTLRQINDLLFNHTYGQSFTPTTMSKDVNNKWVPARPVGYYSLKNRFKFAWKVFTGEADILIWPANQ